MDSFYVLSFSVNYFSKLLTFTPYMPCLSAVRQIAVKVYLLKADRLALTLKSSRH